MEWNKNCGTRVEEFGRTIARKNQYCSTRHWNCRIRAHSIFNICAKIYIWKKRVFCFTMLIMQSTLACDMSVCVYMLAKKNDRREICFFLFYFIDAFLLDIQRGHTYTNTHTRVAEIQRWCHLLDPISHE